MHSSFSTTNPLVPNTPSSNPARNSQSIDTVNPQESSDSSDRQQQQLSAHSQGLTRLDVTAPPLFTGAARLPQQQTSPAPPTTPSISVSVDSNSLTPRFDSPDSHPVPQQPATPAPASYDTTNTPALHNQKTSDPRAIVKFGFEIQEVGTIQPFDSLMILEEEEEDEKTKRMIDVLVFLGEEENKDAINFIRKNSISHKRKRESFPSSVDTRSKSEESIDNDNNLVKRQRKDVTTNDQDVLENPFDCLPSELMLTLMSHLPSRALANCLWVCRYWRMFALEEFYRRQTHDLNERLEFMDFNFDNSCYVWKASDRSLIYNTNNRTFNRTPRPLPSYHQIIFNERGFPVVVGSDNKKLCIWNTETAERILLDEQQATTTSATFSTDRQQLITGHEDGSIIIWNLETKKSIVKFTGHRFPVTSVVVTDDRKFVVSATGSGRGNYFTSHKIRAWDISQAEFSNEILLASPVWETSASTFAVCPRTNMLALIPRLTPDKDNPLKELPSSKITTIQLVALNEKKIYNTVGLSNRYSTLRFSDSGEFLINRSENGAFQLLDLNNKICSARNPTDAQTNSDIVVFTPDSKKVIVESNITPWYHALYDIASSTQQDIRFTLPAYEDHRDTKIVFSENSKLIARTDTAHRRIEVISLENTKVIHSYDIDSEIYLFNSSEADSNNEPTTHLLDLRTGAHLHSVTSQHQGYGYYSPNGKVRVTIDHQTLNLWPIQEKFPVKSLSGSRSVTRSIEKIAFSPNGQFVIGHYFEWFRVWDLEEALKSNRSSHPSFSCFKTDSPEIACIAINNSGIAVISSSGYDLTFLNVKLKKPDNFIFKSTVVDMHDRSQYLHSIYFRNDELIGVSKKNRLLFKVDIESKQIEQVKQYPLSTSST